MGPMPFYGFQPLGAGNLSPGSSARTEGAVYATMNTAFRSLVEECQRVGRSAAGPRSCGISDELSNTAKRRQLGVELAKVLKGMPRRAPSPR